MRTLSLLAVAALAFVPACGGLVALEPAPDADADAGPLCPAPSGDCDSDPTNGCETDLATTDAHCGACGHGCQGGHCEVGLCQAIVIAHDEPWAYRLAVDGLNLYWTRPTEGAVVKKSISGGDAVILASGLNSPGDLAIDGTSVLFGTSGDGTIGKVPIGGGAVSTIASGQGVPWSVAVIEGRVIWSDQMSGTVSTLAPGAAAPVTVWPGPGAWYVAADHDNVYWTALGQGEVRAAPLGGGKSTLLASDLISPKDIAVEGDEVFFTENGPGSVSRVPRAGGTVSLVSDQGGDGVAVDATHVYFGAHDGRILRVPRGGGEATVIAKGPHPAVDIALDAVSVYWTSASGKGLIMKVAK